MKRGIFALGLGVLLPSAAWAQTPQPPAADYTPVVLSAAEFNGIITYLSKLPYEQAAPLINLLLAKEREAHGEGKK